MKKIFIISVFSILMLTGCGATETLSCTYQTTANNGSTKVMYDIDHEDEEIKKVRITYDYKFGANNNNSSGNDNMSTRDLNENTTNNNGNTNDDASLNDTTNNNTDGTNNNNANTNTGNANNNSDINTHTDGVGTGTDGTTNDTQIDDDGVVDGIVGSAIDTIVGGVTDIILDSAGLRDRHQTVQSTYGNVNGFSVQNTNDVDDNYKVTYVIDYDSISDDDLARFNLSRNLKDLRDSYVNQGFTCK